MAHHVVCLAPAKGGLLSAGKGFQGSKGAGSKGKQH